MPKIVEHSTDVKTGLVERNVYMGIDPGKNGGIALLFDSEVVATRMPETPADVLAWIRESASNCIAVIEQVSGYRPGRGGQPGSAMFTFGRGVGHLEMALLACGIPSESVPPRKWQKALGISGKKENESDTQWKNRLKAFAQRLFPSEKVTLATSDALLIALYCKRKNTGTL